MERRWIRCYFFFFKQKTAYEMRISDWSSDVCSSDLPPVIGAVEADSAAQEAGLRAGDRIVRIDGRTMDTFNDIQGAVAFNLGKPANLEIAQIGTASCRERGCQYVSYSVVAVSLKTQT